MDFFYNTRYFQLIALEILGFGIGVAVTIVIVYIGCHMIAETKVLIADDEPGVRQALIRAIHRRFNRNGVNISIYQAENGEQAISIAEEAQPNVILMDIRMPKLDGIQACSILRSKPKFDATIIMLLTCEVITEIEGLKAGADDYILKPFDINALMIRLDRSIQNNQSRACSVKETLTGVCNRNYLINERLNGEIARTNRGKYPLSFLLLQISNFSHTTSLNQQLKCILSTMNFRESDIIARWKKDTFAILLPETNVSSAMIFAQKMLNKIKEKYPLIVPFIGISGFDNNSSDKFIMAAETSLLRAQLSKKITVNGNSNRQVQHLT